MAETTETVQSAHLCESAKNIEGSSVGSADLGDDAVTASSVTENSTGSEDDASNSTTQPDDMAADSNDTTTTNTNVSDETSNSTINELTAEMTTKCVVPADTTNADSSDVTSRPTEKTVVPTSDKVVQSDTNETTSSEEADKMDVEASSDDVTTRKTDDAAETPLETTENEAVRSGDNVEDEQKQSVNMSTEKSQPNDVTADVPSTETEPAVGTEKTCHSTDTAPDADKPADKSAPSLCCSF